MTARGSFTVEKDAVRLRGPLTADIEDTRMEVQGVIALAPRLAGSRLSIGVTAPDLASVVGMFAPAELVPPLPVDLKGEVSLLRDGLRFDDVRGSLGQSSIGIEGSLKLAQRIAGSLFSVASSGPAFEELVAHIPDVKVHPGEYDLSGEFAFDADAIHSKGIRLSRPRGEVTADVTMGLLQSKPLVDFDVSSRGASLHSILTSIGDFDVDDAPFSVAARGNVRDGRLHLARFNVGVGEATLKANGELDLELAGRSTAFDFDLNVPDLARLGQFQQRRLREQSLTMTAKVVGNSDVVKIDNFIVRLGDSDLRGSMRLQRGEVPKLAVELWADELRFAPLLEDAAVVHDAAPRFDDGRLIPDVAVPFEAMRKFDASVLFNIKALQRESLILTDINMRAELKDGALLLHEVALKGRSGWLQANGALEPADGAGKAKLALRARDLRMGLTTQGVGPTTNSNIDVNVEAAGTDLRTLAGNSTGVLFLDMRNFTVPNNTVLSRLYGDMLNEIVDTINPFSKADKETRVDCVILPVEINDGQLGVNPEALVRTDKIQIVSDASINLKTEKLEMTFRTTPRKGMTISAAELMNPFVMVVGTLAAPRLAVDAKGGLISGGAAVATGGLSILARATWERLTRSKDPCGTASKQGIEILKGRFAEFPTEIPAAD
jgi:hypothetical protein